jgi:hypothetical protein
MPGPPGCLKNAALSLKGHPMVRFSFIFATQFPSTTQLMARCGRHLLSKRIIQNGCQRALSPPGWPIAGKKYVITNSRGFPTLGANASKKEGLQFSATLLLFSLSSLIPERRLRASISLIHGAYHAQTPPFEAGNPLSRRLISWLSHYDRHSCQEFHVHCLQSSRW